MWQWKWMHGGEALSYPIRPIQWRLVKNSNFTRCPFFHQKNSKRVGQKLIWKQEIKCGHIQTIQNFECWFICSFKNTHTTYRQKSHTIWLLKWFIYEGFWWYITIRLFLIIFKISLKQNYYHTSSGCSFHNFTNHMMNAPHMIRSWK